MVTRLNRATIIFAASKSTGRTTWTLFSLIGVFALAGCANLHPTRTGYLTDYSHLQTNDSRKPLIHSRMVEKGGKGSAALIEIDAFFIEPIGWMPGAPNADSYEESSRKNLTAKLEKSLVEELGKLKPIVDTPGPRTARVRAAITQIVFAKPFINSALSIVAVPLFNGGSVVEAEIIAANGGQAAAVVAALPGRTTDVVGFFTWQGHAEKAMHRAAVELRNVLDPPAEKPTTVVDKMQPYFTH